MIVIIIVNIIVIVNIFVIGKGDIVVFSLLFVEKKEWKIPSEMEVA